MTEYQRRTAPFPNHLRRTRKLLAWYDRQGARRARLLNAIESNQDVAAYFTLCQRHELAVKEAFALDTKSINSHEHAMLADIDTLRQWCAKATKQDRLK